MKKEYIKPNVKMLLLGELLVPIYTGSTDKQLSDEEIDDNIYEDEEESMSLWK